MVFMISTPTGVLERLVTGRDSAARGVLLPGQLGIAECLRR